MSIKGAARRMIEEAFEVRIVRRKDVPIILEQEHLRKFFEAFDVDCVFDVGANVGQYAHMLRREIGFTGAIVSFEPMPEHAAALRSAAEGQGEWYVEEMALDMTEGTATFNVFAADQFSSLHSVSTEGSGLFEAHTKLSRQIRVKTSTAATQFQKYRDKLGFRRPFLKMDTQGHDLNVAKGAGKFLREFVGLQSELAIQRLYDDSPSFGEALAFYTANGFELSAFVPNNYGYFPRLLEIDCIMYRKSSNARET